MSTRQSVPLFDSELEWLFYYLWFKPSLFKFKIAETVVLKPKMIDNWYFTASQGHILKKNRSNVTFYNINNKFAEKLNSNFEHVAATAYHYGKEFLTLEHIATHDFQSFADMVEKSMSGSGETLFRVPQVVQKFVYSKSSKN